MWKSDGHSRHICKKANTKQRNTEPHLARKADCAEARAHPHTSLTITQRSSVKQSKFASVSRCRLEPPTFQRPKVALSAEYGYVPVHRVRVATPPLVESCCECYNTSGASSQDYFDCFRKTTAFMKRTSYRVGRESFCDLLARACKQPALAFRACSLCPMAFAMARKARKRHPTRTP